MVKKILDKIKLPPALIKPAASAARAVRAAAQAGRTAAQRAAAAGRVAGPLLRRYGPPAAGIMLAAASAAAVIMLRPYFVERYQDFVMARRNRPLEMARRGEDLSREGRHGEAFNALRQAIDMATSAEERAVAGASMGRLLLHYARRQPNPYAQMARSYLEAAVQLEPDPAVRSDLFLDLTEAATLMDDQRAVLEYCEQGLDLADTPAGRVAFMLARLDALLRVGNWASVSRAWEDAREYRDDPRWRNQFELREALIIDAALSNREWYAELVRQSNGRRDPVSLRPALVQRALAIYDRLAEADPALADVCRFRAARLCSAENRFAEARRRIADYFARNHTGHNEDMLLLLTRMVRLEGKTPETNALISTCLERFQWQTRTIPQVLELVAAAEAVGHYPEALYYLEEYMRALDQPADDPRLLFNAGRLAARLQRHGDALGYFHTALLAGPDDALFVSILLAAAEVNMQAGDLNAAQDALVTALTRFPYDPRRGRVLYRLVDVFSRSEAPLADILLVTSLAVNVAPDDPASVAVLMQMARLYEQLGLYPQAQDKYAKVALLRTIAGDHEQRILPVSEALLGSARCLMKMGDIVRADRVLRELCQISKVDPIHSAAAYLWATIAMQDGQYQEARRRLALVDLAHCTPDVRARVQLDGMLIDIAMERRPPETVPDFLKNIVVLPPAERDDYIRRAYALSFERVLERETPERIQVFIDRAAAHARVLPLSAWVMRLAARLLEEQGLPEFIACIEYNLANLGDADMRGAEDLGNLVKLAASLETTKQRVIEQLQ